MICPGIYLLAEALLQLGSQGCVIHRQMCHGDCSPGSHCFTCGCTCVEKHLCHVLGEFAGTTILAAHVVTL